MGVYEFERRRREPMAETDEAAPSVRRASEGERPPAAAEQLGVICTKVLARRAFMSVWRATNKDGAACAVTVVEMTASPAQRAQFARAADALSSSTAAGVLRVQAVSPAKDAFVSDLWTTGTAADLPVLRWPLAQKIGFARRVAESLAALHAEGHVHGCLSPANIALSDDLAPVLTEVSMVCVATSFDGDRENIFGFGAYAAPEAMDRVVTDPRSDVYSVGRLLLFLILDADPGPENTAPASKAPARVTDVVRRCTMPSPDARYADMAELAADLARCAEETAAHDSRKEAPVAAPPPPPKRGPHVPVAWKKEEEARPSRWKKPILAALVMAAFAGVSFYIADPGHTIAHRDARRRLRSGSSAQRANAACELVSSGDRQLAGAKLEGADLSGLNMSAANLKGADLSGAMLTRANLTGASVEGLRLAGAFLQGTVLTNVMLEGAVGLDTALCDETTILPQGWSCKNYVLTAR